MDSIADVVGAALYQEAGCNALRPPRAGAVDVAIRVLERGCIILQPHAYVEADIGRRGRQRVITIRRGTPPCRMNFLVGQQLARIWLDGEPWYLGLDEEHRRAMTLAIGAWIAAPTPAFLAQIQAAGAVDIAALAKAFAVTETCAAMRVSETGGPDAAVMTPDRVYRRGRLFLGFGDADLRTLATKRAPRSVRKVVIRDEPGRIALLARVA